MKKIIFSAAFILILGGFAAAQSVSSKQATTTKEKAPAKKGTSIKTMNKKNTTLTQGSSSNAKMDSVKISLPAAKLPFDSTVVPKVKNE